MTPEQLLVALFETVTEQVKLPEGYEWAPLGALGALTLFGLVLLLRGAKWAPGLAALTFFGLGGWAGAFLAKAIGIPIWPAVAVVGLLGGVLAVVTFRFWQALLLSACCMIAGLSVYFVQSLHPEVANWRAGLNDAGLPQLPPAGTVVADAGPTVAATLGSLWAHLAQTVPNFTATFWTLVLATGLVGLIVGLWLPRVSRALWAASLGTVSFGIGCTFLVKHFAPGVYDWLLAGNARAWGIVGVVWLASFLLNLLGCRRSRSLHKKSDRERAPAKTKPATA